VCLCTIQKCLPTPGGSAVGTRGASKRARRGGDTALLVAEQGSIRWGNATWSSALQAAATTHEQRQWWHETASGEANEQLHPAGEAAEWLCPAGEANERGLSACEVEQRGWARRSGNAICCSFAKSLQRCGIPEGIVETCQRSACWIWCWPSREALVLCRGKRSRSHRSGSMRQAMVHGPWLGDVSRAIFQRSRQRWRRCRCTAGGGPPVGTAPPCPLDIAGCAERQRQRQQQDKQQPFITRGGHVCFLRRVGRCIELGSSDRRRRRGSTCCSTSPGPGWGFTKVGVLGACISAFPAPPIMQHPHAIAATCTAEIALTVDGRFPLIRWSLGGGGHAQCH